MTERVEMWRPWERCLLTGYRLPNWISSQPHSLFKRMARWDKEQSAKEDTALAAFASVPH